MIPELESIAQTLGQFRFPKKITIEVCSECNLECVMCHQPSMKRAKGVMPYETWVKCADEIARESPDTECWFSFCGEPLLEPDLLCRVLSYGKAVGLTSLNINTNGMLLTPEVVRLVLDTGVDVIVIGIDGFTRETYERIRVGGDKKVLYANIEDLLRERSRRRANTEIQVQFIEMEENQKELEDFRKYWLAKDAVVKIRRMLSWGGRIKTPIVVPSDDRIPCPWAITVMHVCWDGRIPRCPGDTEAEQCVGNVKDTSLSVLWERLGWYRDLHLERRFDELPELCQLCKDWMTGAAERDRPAKKILPPHDSPSEVREGGDTP